MRKSFAFFLFIALGLILLIVLLSRQSKQQRLAPLPTPATNITLNTSPTVKLNPPEEQKVFTPTNEPQIINDREKTNEIRQYMEALNKPIDFYGQITDQNGDPVSGVKVKCEVMHLKVIVPAAWGDEDQIIPIEKETDLGGLFEINGVIGRGLDIASIQKAGYLLSPKAPNHFAPGTGSQQRPAVIKMWKEGPKEPLVGGSHVFGMDVGKTYTLDLINGKKIEGEAEGDLRISITRPPDAKPRDKFPWSFSIEAIGGGLAEADPFDEFMYLAPESGYEPKNEKQFDPNDPAWIGIVKKQIFIRSRNGHVYCRAEIEIDSIYNVHSAIQIKYAANPNASRNLQP